MGTNYYVRYNICKECERYDEIHIGKSSAGWTFTFQAQEDEVTIKSYKEWLSFLSKKGVKIFDEYNRKISLQKFKELVEAKRNERNNHAKQYPEGSFLDEKGNSFSEGEFS